MSWEESEELKRKLDKNEFNRGGRASSLFSTSLISEGERSSSKSKPDDHPTQVDPEKNNNEVILRQRCG